MATITASLVGTVNPQAVQVVVNGLTVGQAFEIRGQLGAHSWPVRAGLGVAAASQVVRRDLLAPINAAVTYTVTVDGTPAAESAPITVPFAGGRNRYVLQSLGGTATAAPLMLENGLPESYNMRASSFAVPGRRNPVVMYDIAGGRSTDLLLQTQDAATDDLRALLTEGAPMALRTDGTVRDLPPVQVLVPTSVQSTATWVTYGGGSGRNWQIGYVTIDDPEPNAIPVTSTWADFDRAYSGLTWADFDAEWAGSTWDAFDLMDWSVR